MILKLSQSVDEFVNICACIIIGIVILSILIIITKGYALVLVTMLIYVTKTLTLLYLVTECIGYRQIIVMVVCVICFGYINWIDHSRHIFNLCNMIV